MIVFWWQYIPLPVRANIRGESGRSAAESNETSTTMFGELECNKKKLKGSLIRTVAESYMISATIFGELECERADGLSKSEAREFFILPLLPNVREHAFAVLFEQYHVMQPRHCPSQPLTSSHGRTRESLRSASDPCSLSWGSPRASETLYSTSQFITQRCILSLFPNTLHRRTSEHTVQTPKSNKKDQDTFTYGLST